MSVRYHCDGPDCARPAYKMEATSAEARTTSLEVPGLRDRENPAERPIVFLPPFGWTPIAMKDGRRLYACCKACVDAIVRRETREPTGRRVAEHCPACGQTIDRAEPRVP